MAQQLKATVEKIEAAAQQPPGLSALIVQAFETEADLHILRDAESRARLAATEASNQARAAWDAVYAELLKVKQDNQTSDSFKSSKLGKLLENAR